LLGDAHGVSASAADDLEQPRALLLASALTYGHIRMWEIFQRRRYEHVVASVSGRVLGIPASADAPSGAGNHCAPIGHWSSSRSGKTRWTGARKANQCANPATHDPTSYQGVKLYELRTKLAIFLDDMIS